MFSDMAVDGVPGIDGPKLARWLSANGIASGDLTDIELIAGGRSNLTYRVDLDSSRLVLRRPPLGHVLPTAHDMSREFRVLSALAGTRVPVAPLVASSTDVEMIAAIHGVDVNQVGLGDLGRGAGYLRRQLDRWQRQWELSVTEDRPGYTQLVERLTAALPAEAEGQTTLVHGDYRLDNALVMLNPRPRITAVVDWEMATLGDPLADLGLTLVYWTEDGEEGWLTPAGSPAGTRGVTADATASPGFWTRAEFAAEYARLTGRDVSRIGYYVAFGYFKLAVVLEGIHARYQQGKTVGEGFEQEGFAVPLLIARAHQVLDTQSST